MGVNSGHEQFKEPNMAFTFTLLASTGEELSLKKFQGCTGKFFPGICRLFPENPVLAGLRELFQRPYTLI